MDRAIERHQYESVAYVFMPDHVHLLVWPSATASGISQLLYAIKKPLSYRVKQAMIADADPMLDVLTIRERPRGSVFPLLAGGARFRSEHPRCRSDRANDRLHSSQPDASVADQSSVGVEVVELVGVFGRGANGRTDAAASFRGVVGLTLRPGHRVTSTQRREGTLASGC